VQIIALDTQNDVVLNTGTPVLLRREADGRSICQETLRVTQSLEPILSHINPIEKLWHSFHCTWLSLTSRDFHTSLRVLHVLLTARFI
jgi:hypothetical protein